MKKILAICLGILLLTGCTKSPDGCSSPGSFTASANGLGGITVAVSGAYGFTLAEYGPNGYTRGNGTQVTLSANGGTISGLPNGTYDVYLQGNCGGSSNSSWAGPKSVLVTGGTGSCPVPSYLTASSVSNTAYVNWNYYQTNLFEVEYGPTGFTIGQGDTLLSNNDYVNIGSITYDTTYDFIVRAKCSDGSWSAWSPRFSYYCDFNNNLCAAPANILSSVNASTVQLSWSPEGMTQWEYGISTVNAAPTSIAVATTPQAAYGNLTSGVTYYFYVRGICNGNNRTAWTVKSFQD